MHLNTRIARDAGVQLCDVPDKKSENPVYAKSEHTL